MNNQEKTKEAIKNEQSRENQRGNQWFSLDCSFLIASLVFS
jgi:hypothetical protein